MVQAIPINTNLSFELYKRKYLSEQSNGVSKMVQYTSKRFDLNKIIIDLLDLPHHFNH